MHHCHELNLNKPERKSHNHKNRYTNGLETLPLAPIIFGHLVIRVNPQPPYKRNIVVPICAFPSFAFSTLFLNPCYKTIANGSCLQFLRIMND